MASLYTNFKLFRRKWNFVMRMEKEKNTLTYGFGNRCSDGRYVLFLDYDYSDEEMIRAEIDLLHEMYPFQLGTAYIWKTKHGFHVVFLEKQTLGSILTFMDVSSADRKHRDVALYYTRRIWILRTKLKKGEKRNYVGCVRNPNGCLLPRSAAHADWMTRFLAVPQYDVAEGGPFDGLKAVSAGYYYLRDEL